MRKSLNRLTAFFLILLMTFSMIPTAMAAEAAGDPAETTTETTAPTTEPAATETAATEPTAAETASDEMDTPSGDCGIMPFAFSDMLTNVTLFDLASPYNYTIMLPSQVTVKYKPNGTDSAKTAYLKNIAWHFYSYGGTQYKDDTIYCIEPHKNFAASTPGNYCDQGADVYGSSNGSNGSNVWYNMPTSYRSAIAYILQFSEMRWDHSVSVTNTPKGSNPNFPLRTATQVLIYEIVMGLRDADTFERNDSNGYVEGRILYDAFKDQVPNFRDSYNALVSDVQNAERIPSFCGSSSSNAPTITLTDYLTWVNDSNGVLPDFTFPEDGDVYFNVYGNDMCIENYGAITGSRASTCYRARPSTGSASFSVFYPSGSTYQTCVNLLTPATSKTYGYFKVYAPVSTGDLSLTKTTSDGKNLSGWQFSIYSNSACTNLVSGPHTTNSSGKISVSGLSAGTYYVKEIGHQTSSINSQYTCTSANPQKVTISSGTTASVSFHNKLNTGSAKLIKQTNTGTNRSGWKIGLYTDKACTAHIPGSPFTIGEDGTFTVTGLTPGTFYALEQPSDDPAWQCDTEVKTVTVAANQTASVTFNNTFLPGQLAIQKVNHEGNALPGAEFLLEWSENGTDWQPVAYSETLKKGGCSSPGLADGRLLSGEDGTASFQGLYPGLQYRLTETKAPNNYQLLADFAFEGELPANENYTVEVTIVNNPIYQLPKTGSKGRIVTIVSLLTCVAGLAGAVLYLRRRRW